eukprot:gene20446-24287_t
MDEISILNELKSLILSKAGIRTVTPGDCKRISIEISKTLNKNVSETTIKRLFGFAAVKHHFSQFTLTTLFEYADSEKMMKMLTKEKPRPEGEKGAWENLRYYAHKVTDFSLKSIKNRSALPYHMTISRKFAEHDFEEFYAGKHSFMSFISQPGYGKTTLLGHLVEDFFRKEHAPYKNSTILFVKADSFFNKDSAYFSLEEQVRTALGISHKKDLFSYLHQLHQNNGGKFILIIDGFAEMVLNKEKKNQLFDSILSFICALDNTELIKVVLSMRSNTWIRFYERMRHSSYLKASWFQGNYFDIISNTGHFDTERINPKLKAQLKFPFHIHLYYQLKEEDPFISYYTNIAFYELVSRFIKEKIYKSNYYTEKILFLKKIIQLTNYGQSQNFVAKDLLIAELSAFKNAYMELVSDGILMEEKRYQNLHPKEFVRFVHPHIFEYFLFIELLEKFNLNVGPDFLQDIDSTYSSNHVRFILLQWTIRYMAKIADFSGLSNVFKLELNNYERNYLILFIAENLKYVINLHPELKTVLQEQQLHEAIIAELISFDFVDSCYKQAISVLIDICDTEENWLVYQSILSTLDILSLDQDKIKARILLLEEHKVLCSGSLFNPLEALHLAYRKSRNIPVDPRSFLNKIDEFILSGENFKRSESKDPDTRSGLMYLMVLSVNFLFGTAEKALKIIESIHQLHPRIFYQRAPFSAYLLLMLAINASKSVHCGKMEKIRQFIFKLSDGKHHCLFTKYSELLLMMLDAELCKQRGDYQLGMLYAEEAITVAKRNDLSINCIWAYNLIIEICLKSNDMIKLNEYKVERISFLSERKIPKELFPVPAELAKNTFI